MKSNSGIDLSELTQAQRKMCVRLLAVNNVHFIQNNDNYVATLRVPTSQLKNYIVNKKSSQNQHQSHSKHDKKTSKYIKQSSRSKQKQKQKSKQKQNKIAKISSTVKQQSSKFRAGKKPLFKSIKLPIISKVQILHPQVQIYVYPKKIPVLTLQQQIQQTYDVFWQITRQGIVYDFHKCYYDIVCPQNINLIKAKNDQNLVNSLQTMNHFQHKQLGVKIFYFFLSQTYKNQHLSYFLVLRALLEQLVGQKIVNQKYKPKQTIENNLVNRNTTINSNGKQRLRWNPFEKQLSEFICQNFLRVVVAKSNTVDNMFQKLTQSMYYCQQKKGNYIRYYDLIDFMLKNFNQECQDITTTNLELSYSNNDSTLNDIIAESVHKSTDRPLQTKFQLSLVNQSSLNVEDQPQQKEVFDNDKILTEQAIKKAKQICKRLFIPLQTQNQILQKVYQCIKSIIDMDKIKWIEVLGLQGTESEINFIQQIQIAYKTICREGHKLAMSNNIIKRIFVGPGFIKLFSKNVSF